MNVLERSKGVLVGIAETAVLNRFLRWSKGAQQPRALQGNWIRNGAGEVNKQKGALEREPLIITGEGGAISEVRLKHAHKGEG